MSFKNGWCKAAGLSSNSDYRIHCHRRSQALAGERMFDHVKFGVSDYAASKAFFLKALEPLGVTVAQEGPPQYGVELSAKGEASLVLYQTEEKPAHLHLAFTAENRQQVEPFFPATMDAGGTATSSS